MENLLKRIYTISEKNDIIKQFQLEVSLVCFRPSFLNRMIQGFKVFQEQIKALRFNYANKNVGQAHLLVFLTKNNLAKDIFGFEATTSSSLALLILSNSWPLKMHSNKKTHTLSEQPLKRIAMSKS